MDADRRIERDVEAALTRERRINLDQSEIAIVCREGTVELSGTVPGVAAKRLAAALAGRVEDVEAVEDNLRVGTSSPMGDRELTEHVRNALVQERNLEEDQIQVEADPQGEVTLWGTVHSLIQVRLAEVLCWWVPGTTNVRNRLDMYPREEDSDEELKDNLTIILEKDVLVNPKKFSIEVRGGEVTLRGSVDEATEKDSAEKDCWYTPGVREVKNDLVVAGA